MTTSQEKTGDDHDRVHYSDPFTKDERGGELAPQETTRRGSVWSIVSRRESTQRRFSISDDVFGEITEKGPNYRDVGWLGTVVLMLKTQIGLGVLSIPAAFDALGMIPGILCLLSIGGIITWGNHIVGVFKRKHPEVYSIVDVGEKLGGKVGKEAMGVAFLLWWICVAAAGISSISTSFNAMSVHGACTAIFVAVAAIIGFMTGSIRTLGKISWLAWVGVVSILVALLTLTIAVGVQDRPAEAPQTGPYQSNYKLIGNPTFNEAMGAINGFVFAYAGTPAFFAIISEMRDPRQYDKSMLTCQGIITAIYLLVGIVVYYYCGSFVASPALGSAGPLLKRICYGLALPGLIASTCLVVHYPAKYMFLRTLRGSKHLVSNSAVHWMTWLSCTLSVTIVGYIIASAVPNFGSLISLVGSLFGTLMSFQPLGAMWLYDNWKGRRRDTRWIAGVCWSTFVIIIGTYIMVAGSYTAISGIIADYKASGGSGAWSCADNSNSVKDKT
ncbi:transmembrane amino acid transporter protein-domain-containing protein [Pyrenochaeta sp. MPI-SDFR-AT-0127]|nr:transmembrane amino acid transporter protein-domain-containing protein [Pyrenochaeta sp. MPI-SDFR-AT-0127]